ncbi:single-stranded DNA-binding protein [Gelria sp. Kuro-4]|uniref:single-stranded DNA-binding protein n=1 Tax=Gelria sp. Kuro-4 TaxID=2796927 RepID=UPI001BF0A458|nr:single-stranded DNA-binding protein [Gelria sp. Kuro-4]BCV23863.1 single-stranded DNA-binding protein [Gelria sp. Kuro-4]
MLNRVILIGRLTRDPELRYTAAGVPVARFTLAVDRSFTNQQGQRETDFIDIVVWRRQAEICTNNLSKGRLVAVEGRLQIRSYETQDGQKRRAAEVVADSVQFLDWPKAAVGAGGGQSSGSPSGEPSGEPSGTEVEYNLDDVPF